MRHLNKCLVLFSIILMALFASMVPQGLASINVFSDDFDGTSVDTEKWVVQEGTSMSGNPAYGGSVKVADGKISLSSSGSSFPWIQTAANPFPTEGDFAIEFRFNYTQIGHWGNGLWITGQPAGEPYTLYDIFSADDENIFVLWADDENIFDHEAIRAYLLGREIYHSEAYGSVSLGYKMGAHVFRLEYFKGVYTLLIDGSEIASAPSQIMPKIIGFGHPPAPYVPFTSDVIAKIFSDWRATWNSFEIDYINMLHQATISLSTSTSSAPLGFGVDISGKLNSLEGVPLPNATIVLSHKFQESPTWSQTTSTMTTQDGSYLVTWLPSATGSFAVKVEWSGNEAYAGTFEIKNISVTRDYGESLLLAESNSTLSALTVNTESSEIYFSVSGPTGTSGYVRFLISKSLVGNPTDLKVYIDGRQIEYSASSIGDLQLLYFTYSHSSHEIAISLPELNQAPDHFTNQAGFNGVELAILIALTVMAALLGVLVTLRLKKKH